MDKGERTKQRIVAQSTPLFNAQGYAGTSMGDVMQVTGLQKGGIYRHFESKDDLALAAFDFAFARTKARFAVAIRENAHTVTRLLAIIQAHADLLNDPLLAGGCPILNTAVESDDTHPELRRRAQAALDAWLEMLRITLEKGIARGEMKEVDTEEVITVVIATLEGALMMSKLYGDKKYLETALKYLSTYIEREVTR